MNEIDNIQDYEELIGELKMLYTVVTRARCTLILHDNNIPEDFLYIWNSHNLVESDINRLIEQYANSVQSKF